MTEVMSLPPSPLPSKSLRPTGRCRPQERSKLDQVLQRLYGASNGLQQGTTNNTSTPTSTVKTATSQERQGTEQGTEKGETEKPATEQVDRKSPVSRGVPQRAVVTPVVTREINDEDSSSCEELEMINSNGRHSSNSNHSNAGSGSIEVPSSPSGASSGGEEADIEVVDDDDDDLSDGHMIQKVNLHRSIHRLRKPQHSASASPVTAMIIPNQHHHSPTANRHKNQGLQARHHYGNDSPLATASTSSPLPVRHSLPFPSSSQTSGDQHITSDVTSRLLRVNGLDLSGNFSGLELQKVKVLHGPKLLHPHGSLSREL